jgi:hypothetical protein
VASGDLCQLADVKAWLSLGGPAGSPGAMQSSDDSILERLITAESQDILSWLGRPLLSADWIETRDGLNGIYGQYESRFQFGVTPCTAVLQVIVSGTTIPSVPTTTPAPPGQSLATYYTTTAGYEFSPTQLVIRGYLVPRRAQCVQIQYTAGYASVPVDVEQAAIELVALTYKARQRVGELSKRIGEEVVSYDRSPIPPSIARKLQPYRLVAPIYGLAPVLAPTATDTATLAAAI